jgi:very-short-patch-repair endonuclease
MNETKIVSLYNSGHSTYDLAKKYETYPNKIRRILIKHGVQLKDKSEAQKNAIKNGDAKIPTQGKRRTKEEKLKISKTLQNTWKNLDKNIYQEYVNRSKRRWESMSDKDKDNMKSLAIKAIQIAGKEGSKLEKFLKKELESLGHEVEVHKKNLIPNENLEIDIYLPKLKTIIEVDGPSHFLPIWGEEKLQKQIKSDEQKTGLILSKGLAIIRVKHLKDSLSLASKESLKSQIIDILEKMKSKFPEKSKRFIEIEA